MSRCKGQYSFSFTFNFIRILPGTNWANVKHVRNTVWLTDFSRCWMFVEWNRHFSVHVNVKNFSFGHFPGGCGWPWWDSPDHCSWLLTVQLGHPTVFYLRRLHLRNFIVFTPTFSTKCWLYSRNFNFRISRNENSSKNLPPVIFFFSSSCGPDPLWSLWLQWWCCK